MSDAKFFSKGKASELEAELRALDKIGGGKSVSSKKKDVLKRIVANMTTGTDMSSLFNQVVLCCQIPGYDTKKLVYMYLIHYAKLIPDLATLAVNVLIKDTNDENPLVRAHAIRTMGYIASTDMMHALVDVIRARVTDPDPFVRKACVFAVLKIVHQDSQFCLSEGLIETVHKLVFTDANPKVIASGICTIMEMLELVPNCTQFTFDSNFANKLFLALDECSQWYQVYILQSFMYFHPNVADDALLLAERLTSRLQHTNSAVTLTVLRVIIHLQSYLTDPKYTSAIVQLGTKIASPLVTLMSRGPEIQYTALRNIMLIIETYPIILVKELPVFFVKYTDPIYIKLAKLDVLIRLVNADNCATILAELKEYASEVDVEFCRRSVKLIGRCALHVESMSEACMQALLSLLETKVPYVLQEAVVVVRDMFRRYPGKFEAMLGALTDQLDAIDEPEARAAYIWILGQYCTRIENVCSALQLFTTSILSDPALVQLALVTALAKASAANVIGASELFAQVASTLVQGQSNPDVRDRVIIYQRLITAHPDAFARIMSIQNRPTVLSGLEAVPLRTELLVHIGSLASILHKPPTAIFAKSGPKPVLPAEMNAGKKPNNKNDVSLLSGFDDITSVHTPTGYSHNIQHPVQQHPVSSPLSKPAAASGNLLDFDPIMDNPILPQLPLSNLTSSTISNIGSATQFSNNPMNLNNVNVNVSPMSYTLGTPFQGQPSSHASTVNSRAASPNSPPVPYMPMQPSPMSSIPASPPQRPVSAGLLANPMPFTSGVFPQSAPSSPNNSLLGAAQPATQPNPALTTFSGTAGTFNFASQFEGASAKASMAVNSTYQSTNPMSDLLGLNTQQQPPRPMQVQTKPTDLMSELGGGLQSLSLSSPVSQQPPKLLLSAQDGKGLEIHGYMDNDPVRQGQYALNLTLANKSMSLLSNFALKLNKNIFSFDSGSTVCQSLVSNQTQTSCIQLIRPTNSESVPNLDTVPDTAKKMPFHLQAAVRANTQTFYFLVPVPLHLLFRYEPGVKSLLPDLIAVSWLTSSTGTAVEFHPDVPPALVCTRVLDKFFSIRVEQVFAPHAPSMTYRLAATLINSIQIVFQLQAITGKITLLVACRSAKFLETHVAELMHDLVKEVVSRTK